MRKSQNFWDKNAGRYDRFMRKDAAAYERLYELLRPVVRHRTVLELAAGMGLIAKNIVNSAAHIEATDASPEMIAEAKRDNRSAKLHFSVQDMFHLPYADGSFEVIIVANALHIVPEPEKALSEIHRVLKDDGVLVAPTFTHADNAFFGRVKAGREAEHAGVLPPEIQLHVSGPGIGHGVFPGGVFHAPFPAVVDGKQRPSGHIVTFIIGYVKVVEAEHNAGEHIIDGHGPFAALVLELPHGAAVLLGQKLRPLRRERAATQARTGFFHTDRLLSLTIPCG